MPYRPTKATLRNLVALAQAQGGYFTAKQAAKIGYSYPHLDYHLNAGNFERDGRGVYRLSGIPLSEHDDLIRLALWSRGRADLPQAVASHETALAVHGLSDLLPTKIHLTVPLSFRRVAPQGVVLHRRSLSKGDIEARDGFQITTPLRTLVDIAEDDGLADEHLRQAITEALEQGLIRKSSLAAAAKKLPNNGRLSHWLSSLS